MAIVSRAIWSSYTGITLTGDDATSLDSWALGVDRAIKNLIRPFYPEPLPTVTCILDAPNSRDLVLPITPARSITSVYVRSDANGLAANFEVGTSTTYLIDNTDGDEYQLFIDDHLYNYAKRGIVRRVSQNWGSARFRPNDALASRREDQRGSILVNYAAGTLSVPADLEAAAIAALTLLYQRRKTGAPVQSESWNGYSAGYAGPFTAEAAVRSPEVIALLNAGGYLSVGIA